VKALRRGWLAVVMIVVFAYGCSRSIHFPAAEIQNLRPLAGAPGGGEALGARLVSGAGEAVGLVDPDAKVALRGDEVVLVDASTELVLRTAGSQELPFQPGALVFAPAELWLNSTGTLRVPYPRIAGVTLEKFSFGRTLLWTVVIGGTLLLALTLAAIAVGGGGGGGGDHDWD
jgi:hypothetical protein